MTSLKLLVLGLLFFTGLATGADKLPNIVIIVADDLGWADVGYHGSKIRTPHLDRFAKEGVRLENFHVAPLCSPTRAGLMTGRWPIRYGMGESVITPWRKWGLSTEEGTIADMLGKAGYLTRAAVGKWHLGHYKKALLPRSRGFTSFYGHYNGAFDYFTHEREGELDWHRNEETSHDKGYSTDLIGKEAARVVASSQHDEPFFLYVPFNAPHDPMQAKESDLQKYQSIKDQNRRIYAAMVDSMDQAIGRILKAIDNKGIKENTFVLFFSDNGGITRWADNGSWRAGKGTVYEGGVRTVAAVRWPAGFRGERTIDAMMGYIDIFPTLMALVSSEEKLSKPLDGRNMLGVTGGSVLDAKIGKAKPKIELFHLLKDPVESNDLAKQEPEKVEAMLRRMKDHRRLKIAGIPDFLEGKKGFVAPKNWVITD